jgi:hypothetical protein
MGKTYKARKQKHELDKHRFSSSEKRNSRREVSNLASNLARLSSGNSALVLMVGNSGFFCAVLYFLNKWIFSKSLYAVDILYSAVIYNIENAAKEIRKQTETNIASL